ncbi:MAG: hypothetical protein QOH58_1305 [Thermoleophilaceae bacterium]|jgi:hypothetical protein|nr:hypothetical protein [Thermoleophilaceae bacterium]
MTTPITIRRSSKSDALVLRRLAELDSARPIEGPALIAEVGDRAVAAVSLDGRREIADPFERTEQVVALLRAAAA